MLLAKSISSRLIGEVEPPPMTDNVRLGLYTSKELERWAEMSVSGPYKSLGDTGRTNSPGAWDRNLTRANQLLNNSGSGFIIDNYDGPTYYVSSGVNVFITPAISSDYVRQHSKPEPLDFGHRIISAAFVGRVLEERLEGSGMGYINAVKAALLDQIDIIKRPRLDFSNTNFWKPFIIRDINPGFTIAQWIGRLFRAYDFIKNYCSSVERTKIEAWLLIAITFRVNDANRDLNLWYTNTRDGVSTYTYSGLALTIGIGNLNSKLFDGAQVIPTHGKGYNNRRADEFAVGLMIGLFLNNSYLIDSAKIFFKDWLRFSAFPNGFVCEQERGNNPNFPEHAVYYAGLMIVLAGKMADACARYGDFSLYNYVTDGGDFGTEGGAKSLKLTAWTHLGFYDKRYIPEKTYTNPDKAPEILDGYLASHNWFNVGDIDIAQMNQYWKDEEIWTRVRRMHAGNRPFPSNPAGSGANPAYTGPGGYGVDSLFANDLLYGQPASRIINPYETI